MIAKGKSISHGAEALRYGHGKSKSVLLGPLNMSGDKPEDWLVQMELLHQGHERIKNRFLRFEISPSEAESKELKSLQDWARLGAEFIKSMNLGAHQCVCILHQDKKHKHLHIVANRIDVDGNVYTDKFIGKKAVEVAKKMTANRGWQNVEEVGRYNRYKCWMAMKDTMKSMNSYSWEGFKDGMEARGYRITENLKKDGTINGYTILMPGQTLTEGFKGIKASEVNRNCTYSKLPILWRKEHPEFINLKQLSSVLSEWLADKNQGVVSDIVLIGRGEGKFALRCKVNGEQQMGVDLPAKYNSIINLLNDGQKKELQACMNEFDEGKSTRIHYDYGGIGGHYNDHQQGYDDNIPDVDIGDDILPSLLTTGPILVGGSIDKKKKKKR